MSRRTMLGGVRTDSNTSAAPPSARSTAISAPELPPPTTNTLRPRYGSALRYSEEWMTWPANDPGQSGTKATLLFPVATTTRSAASKPSLVSRTQAAPARSILPTSIPVRTSSLLRSA
jgi:hypothetical protein